MRLGIFAGGFKPFHAGHFAKLALAASENDLTFLVYGLASRQKNSDFVFTEEMAREIFSITREAIENKMQGRVVVIEGKPSPWTVVFEIMAAIFRGVQPKNPEISSMLTSLASSLEDAEITIYSSAADSERDQKFLNQEKQAALEGRLRIDIGDDGTGTTDRVESALAAYQSAASRRSSAELVGIRGSDVRAAITRGSAEELSEMLPPIFTPDQKRRVLRALDPVKFSMESRVRKAILNQFSASHRKRLLEASPEAHILNFYEDLDLPISELKEAMRAILEGRVENVQEKLDGQNITFTVRNGQVETFTKGTSWSRVQRGGRSMEDYDSIYAELPTVRDAFKLSHSALQAVADRHPEITSELFLDGSVIVEASMMIPANPNTIQYDAPRIVFIEHYAVDPNADSVAIARAGEMFPIWTGLAAAERSKPITLSNVPILALSKVMDSGVHAAKLEGELDSIIAESGRRADDTGLTVGDVLAGLAQKRLESMGLSSNDASRGAARVVRGARATNPIKSFERPEIIKEIESSGAFLDEIRIPIERIVQQLATIVFRNLEFALASNDPEKGQELRNFVRKVRQSVQNGNVLADPVQMRSIKLALDRIGDEQAFEKAVEGIVFTWGGKTRKLTGLFTPINKLRGFFNYGKSQARFNETRIAKKVLAEILRRRA